MSKHQLASLVTGLLLTACGGSTDTQGTAGAGGSASGASGSASGGVAGSSSGGAASGDGGTGGDGGSACGNTPPRDGSACALPSGGFGIAAAQCSWGDDPRPACRTHATCSEGAWRVVVPSDGCSTPPKPEACPATPAMAGTACTDAALRCWYDDGTVCSCSPCEGGAEFPICREIDPPEWACVKPAEGCPNPLPQAGSACSEPDLQCGTSCELPIRCQDGTWQYGQEMCPICASPTTPIATPSGYRAIADLRVGDLVYSVQDDAVVAVPIVLVGSTPVIHHEVLEIALSDGGTLEISPGHPLANGNPLSSLTPGSAVDDTLRAVTIQRVPYGFDRTYDILPGSSTGTYFAAGALLGSTLSRPAMTRSP